MITISSSSQLPTNQKNKTIISQRITSPKYSSARQLPSPDYFLNENQIHFPKLEKRIDTETQPTRLTSPKSLRVTPERRVTYNDDDKYSGIAFTTPQTFSRKLRKQRLYLKNAESSRQGFSEFLEFIEKKHKAFIQEMKKSTSTAKSSSSSRFISPIARAAENLLNEENNTFQQIFSQSSNSHSQLIQDTQQMQQLNQQNQSQSTCKNFKGILKGNHKKAVSFRNSVLVVDLQNGNVSKEQMNGGDRMQSLIKTINNIDLNNLILKDQPQQQQQQQQQQSNETKQSSQPYRPHRRFVKMEQ